MAAGSRTRIIKIGNSQGIRIPKLLLEQAGLGDEVELEAGDAQLVIRPASRARQGWDDQFRAMGERGDDRVLDGGVASTTVWDDEEWEW